MRFHRHKWIYLAKEHHVITKKKDYYYHGGLSTLSDGGSSHESVETNVTTIRFYCPKCSDIKIQTVEGTMKSNEIMKLGAYGESDE